MISKKHKLSKKSLLFFISLWCAAFLSSCATQKPDAQFFEPERTPFNNTLLVIDIPQKELNLEIDQRLSGKYGGMMVGWPGVAGFLLELIEVSAKTSRLEKYFKCVCIALRPVDFRNDFSIDLEKRLLQIPRIDLRKTEQISGMDRKELARKLTYSGYDTIIHVRVKYWMMEGFEQIYMIANYDVYNKNSRLDSIFNSYASYTSEYSFNKKPDPCRRCDLRSWVKNDGERIKYEIRNGICSLTREIEFDLNY